MLECGEHIYCEKDTKTLIAIPETQFLKDQKTKLENN